MQETELPERVKQMSAMLKELVDSRRSTPGQAEKRHIAGAMVQKVYRPPSLKNSRMRKQTEIG